MTETVPDEQLMLRYGEATHGRSNCTAGTVAASSAM
jgi:hypothetical protein